MKRAARAAWVLICVCACRPLTPAEPVRPDFQESYELGIYVCACTGMDPLGEPIVTWTRVRTKQDVSSLFVLPDAACAPDATPSPAAYVFARTIQEGFPSGRQPSSWKMSNVLSSAWLEMDSYRYIQRYGSWRTPAWNAETRLEELEFQHNLRAGVREDAATQP